MTAQARLKRDQRSANVVELADGIVEGFDWPLVPDGEYSACLVKHVCVAMAQFKGQPKLFMLFRLVDPGEHFGAILFRAYRVRSILSPMRGTGAVNGRFKVGRRSDLLQDYCRLMDVRIRPDRISLRAMRRHLFKVRTRTVAMDARQRPLPVALRYSVIDTISKETPWIRRTSDL